MGNFTGGEFIIILIVALVVLGPDRLPELARSAGRMIHKLKTMADGMGADVKGVMDDPAMQPLKELGELAARPRQKLAEYALEAEAEERARKEAAAQVAADAADAAADAAEAAAAGTTADEIADTTAPDTTAPDTTAPDTTAPDTIAPDTTAPDTTATDTSAGSPEPEPGAER